MKPACTTSVPSPCSIESLEARLAFSGSSFEPTVQVLAAGSERFEFPAEFAAGSASRNARFEGYNVVIGSKMYALGGFTSTFQTMEDVEIYDSQTRKWSIVKSEVLAADTHAGVAVDGSSIYFAGGYLGALPPGREQEVSRLVWRYDTATNTWDSVAPLPNGRGGGALVTVGRELHYFGGCLGDRVTNSGTHWMLRLGNSTGGSDDGDQWVRRPAMPSPRDHFSAIEHDGLIYAIGGEYGHDVLHSNSRLVHSFDTATGEWKRLRDLPTAKSHAESGTFAVGNQIFFAGGQVDDYRATDDVVSFDVQANRWTREAPLPEPRQGGAIQLIGRTVLIAFGARETNEPFRSAYTADLI